MTLPDSSPVLCRFFSSPGFLKTPGCMSRAQQPTQRGPSPVIRKSSPILPWSPIFRNSMMAVSLLPLIYCRYSGCILSWPLLGRSGACCKRAMTLGDPCGGCDVPGNLSWVWTVLLPCLVLLGASLMTVVGHLMRRQKGRAPDLYQRMMASHSPVKVAAPGCRRKAPAVSISRLSPRRFRPELRARALRSGPRWEH